MWKSTTVTILVLVLNGLVKAHIHFIRLALLLILGLGGMYMLHKLAQDWNRIRGGGGGGGGGGRPQRLASAFGSATRFFRISKRSVDTHVRMEIHVILYLLELSVGRDKKMCHRWLCTCLGELSMSITFAYMVVGASFWMFPPVVLLSYNVVETGTWIINKYYKNLTLLSVAANKNMRGKMNEFTHWRK